MPNTRPGVVIDNGSFNIKAGFTCDNHPVSIFRTVVGRPKDLKGSYGKKYYDVYIGDEAVDRVEELQLNHPVRNGKVMHWDNMERIWHYIFYKQLKVAPEERAVILSMPTLITSQEKLKTCEILFETLNVPSLCVQSQAVLSMYGSGYTTGLCVDLGHDASGITPIYEGGLMYYAHHEITETAGSAIGKYIRDFLLNIGCVSNELDMIKIVEDIKRHYVFVSKDCSLPLSPRIRKKYKLPSGGEIDVTNLALECGEMIFQPELVNTENKTMSIQEAVVSVVMKCDEDLQNDMYSGIVPCGGMSTVPGFNKRLACEIENIVNRPVNVAESAEADTLSWLGGATFAGIPHAQKVCVTKKEYEEYGEKIVRNKFL